MPGTGLEPTQAVNLLEPESSASANSATPARDYMITQNPHFVNFTLATPFP